MWEVLCPVLPTVVFKSLCDLPSVSLPLILWKIKFASSKQMMPPKQCNIYGNPPKTKMVSNVLN
jgi:hypothetical protein